MDGVCTCCRRYAMYSVHTVMCNCVHLCWVCWGKNGRGDKEEQAVHQPRLHSHNLVKLEGFRKAKTKITKTAPFSPYHESWRISWSHPHSHPQPLLSASPSQMSPEIDCLAISATIFVSSSLTCSPTATHCLDHPPNITHHCPPEITFWKYLQF